MQKKILDSPTPNGQTRLKRSAEIRGSENGVSLTRIPVQTQANGEEFNHAGSWPLNFTKGLPHDIMGKVEPDAYPLFVDAINASPFQGNEGFDVPLGPINAAKGQHRPATYKDGDGVQDFLTKGPKGGSHNVRNWESPRSGHVYDLQGPDSAATGMEAAPRMGSSELTAEVAEVYALAALRDVPFADIQAESPDTKNSTISPKAVIDGLNKLSWFGGAGLLQSSFPLRTGPDSQLTGPETNRHQARFEEGKTKLTGRAAFRGSTPGSMDGSYVSQFMLIGSKDNPASGKVPFGAQEIDQRVNALHHGMDFMGDWHSWLDVQNGADLRGHQNNLLTTSGLSKRYIATPRDLASYVRVDALYQAYLNAALLLQNYGLEYENAFPTGKSHPTRGSFATFGDPHILTLVTEVATRALKAVRRQKFNFHRRGRPERIGGLLTHIANGNVEPVDAIVDDLAQMYRDLADTGLMDWVKAHNAAQLNNGQNPISDRGNDEYTSAASLDTPFDSALLPMAFIEGSPMHPAYGAGHATVAGACITVLKAFFQLHGLSMKQMGLDNAYRATADGASLEVDPSVSTNDLTIEGELNKLAANISIGRNMAGVHFYSDYFDSLRMGERIAIGILLEQMPTYADAYQMQLTSFDEEKLTLESQWDGAKKDNLIASLKVSGSSAEDWWLAHVPAAQPFS